MELLEKTLIKSDYYLYTRWRFYNSFGFKFKHNWHFKAICKKLEEIILFEQRKNIVINIPPGYGKSEIISIGLTAYGMGLDPSNKFIVTSYGIEVAENFTAQAKDILNEEWHQEVFPIIMDKSAGAKKFFKTSKKGEVLAAGTGGRVTGYRAGTSKGNFSGIIITDDPLKAGDSESDAKLAEAAAFQDETLESRKMTQDVIKLVVMQRLSELDVSGVMLEKGWDHLCLPAILTLEELKEHCAYVGEDYRKTDSYLYGDHKADEYPLWNWKQSLEVLRRDRGDYQDEGKPGIGSFVFSGQYMQTPAPDGGGVLKDNWFKEYTVLPPIQFKIFTIDSAWDDKTKDDYSVVQCWAKCEGGIYLMDQLRGKWQFHELKKRVATFYEVHRPRYVYIENKQSGIGLIQELKREYMMPVKKLQAMKDKYSRAQDASPSVECGLVYLPHASISPWVSDLREEIKSFPVGKHDDQVDTLVYAVIALCVNQQFIAPNNEELILTPTRKQLESEGWGYNKDVAVHYDNENPWMCY